MDHGTDSDRNRKSRRRAFPSPARLLGVLSIVGIACALTPPSFEEWSASRSAPDYSNRLAFARSLGNHEMRPDLLTRATRSVPGSMKAPVAPDGMAPPPSWAGMRTTGTNRALILCIDFSDFPHNEASNSQPQMVNRLFGDGDAATVYPYESLRNFYRRSSHGKLNLEGTVLGWYRASSARSAVSMTILGRQNLIAEALTYYDGLGHDFTQYDNDGNGRIDYLAVIWSGTNGAWSSFWWGYKTSWSSSVSTLTLDGKTLDDYSWQWETGTGAYPNGSYSPRVIIHETGHILGLPDYYDYDSTVGPKGGLGGLDQMDANAGDHNGFSKWVLDWITPNVYSNSQIGVPLKPAEWGAGNEAAVLCPVWTNNSPFQEYFLIENRTRISNDSVLATDGLLIWHVDARLQSSGNNYLYDNSYTTHKLLRLMEADGLERIEQGTSVYNSPTVFYKTGNTFGPATFPNSKFYDAAAGVLGVRNLNVGAGGSTFDVYGVTNVAAPALNLQYPGPRAVTLSWTAQGSPTRYLVERSLDGSTYTQVTNLTNVPVVTGIGWTNLDPTNAWYYRIQAEYGGEVSPVSTAMMRRLLRVLGLQARSVPLRERLEFDYRPYTSGPVSITPVFSWRPSGTTGWTSIGTADLLNLDPYGIGLTTKGFPLPAAISRSNRLDVQLSLVDDVTTSEVLVLSNLALTNFFGPQSTLAAAQVTGNPWKGTSPVAFVNLPLGATVRIFKPDGRVLKDLTGGGGRLEWTPSPGTPAGLYYGEVSAAGERKIFKVLIP